MGAKVKRFLKTLLLSLVFVFVMTGMSSEAATLSTKKATLKVGQTKTLTVKSAESKVKWTSSNSKIVKIKKTTGKKKNKVTLQALKAGTATIKAKVDGKTLKVKVTVKKFTVNKKSVTINEGGTATITAKNVGANVKWSSSNKAVAVISDINGSKDEMVTIKGLKAGTAMITAKVGNTKLTTTVKVQHVHKWAAATCTRPQTCNTCGATTGRALGHNMSTANCKQVSTCSRCGYKQGGLGEHNWNATTGYCSICGLMNLKQFLGFKIDNVGNRTDLVRLYVVNDGRFELEISPDDGKAVVKLPAGNTVQTRAWYNNYLENGWKVGAYTRGYVYFGSTDYMNLDFGSSITFDIYYNREKYKITITEGTNTATSTLNGYTFTKY